MRSGYAALLRRRYSDEADVTAMLIVVSVIRLELALEIALTPEPDPVQVLAPDDSDQSLDKGMRTWRIGDGLNLFDLEHLQIRSPERCKPNNGSWSEQRRSGIACLAIARLNIRQTRMPSRLAAATPKPKIRRVKMSITTMTQ